MFALGRPPASACGTNFASCAAKAKRPQLTIADRTIMAALSQRMSRAAQVGMLVQPETVLGWHRELVRRKWAGFGRRRGPGRPGVAFVFVGSCSSLGIGFRRRRYASCCARQGWAGTVEIAPDLEGVSASAGRSC